MTGGDASRGRRRARRPPAAPAWPRVRTSLFLPVPDPRRAVLDGAVARRLLGPDHGPQRLSRQGLDRPLRTQGDLGPHWPRTAGGVASGGIGSVLGDVLSNPRIARLVGAYAAFVLAEYSTWIAITVLAFERGGATEAGLVALAQLVPAAVPRPGPGPHRGARNRRGHLTCASSGHLVQATGLACRRGRGRRGPAARSPTPAPSLTSVAVVTTRPAQAAMLPASADTPEQLTAANVALGWVENAGIAWPAWWPGLLLPVSDPALTLAVGCRAACWCAASRPSCRAAACPPAAEYEGRRSRTRSEPWSAVARPTAGAAPRLAHRPVAGRRRPRRALRGARRRRAGRRRRVGRLPAGRRSGPERWSRAAWPPLLVGKRLGVPILLSALVQAVALAAGRVHRRDRPARRAAAGGRRRQAARSSTSRAARCCSVPCRRTCSAAPSARSKALTMGGRAVGSVLVPALVARRWQRRGRWSGSGGGAAPAPRSVAGGPLMTVDARATVPVVEIALLRSLRLFTGARAPGARGARPCPRSVGTWTRAPR